MKKNEKNTFSCPDCGYEIDIEDADFDGSCPGCGEMLEDFVDYDDSVDSKETEIDSDTDQSEDNESLYFFEKKHKDEDEDEDEDSYFYTGNQIEEWERQ